MASLLLNVMLPCLYILCTCMSNISLAYRVLVQCSVAYIDFADNDAFTKAFDLNGSELGGAYLNVQEGKPREPREGGFGSGDRSFGGGRRGRGGDRGGGRSFGRGDRGGRGFGGRGGDRGGRRGGRGPPKFSVTGSASGNLFLPGLVFPGTWYLQFLHRHYKTMFYSILIKFLF